VSHGPTTQEDAPSRQSGAFAATDILGCQNVWRSPRAQWRPGHSSDRRPGGPLSPELDVCARARRHAVPAIV